MEGRQRTRNSRDECHAERPQDVFESISVWHRLLITAVSPGINIVSVKAFDENGVGTYRDVIRGIAFVVENKDVYNIRVLNLSFSATPQSHLLGRTRSTRP